MRVRVILPSGEDTVVNFTRGETLEDFGLRLKVALPQALKASFDDYTIVHAAQTLNLKSTDAVPFEDDDVLEVRRGSVWNAVAQPIQIIKIDDKTKKFSLLEGELKKMLLSHSIQDLPVVVISVAGPFRTGKSFLLNFLIRYLESEGGEDWLGEDPVGVEEGFTWKHGVERDTTGLWLWGRPYIRTLPKTGEKVAVLVVDTQGTFDNVTTTSENAGIFAFNSLLSSHQIYNIKEKIQEDVLQHMHLFTSYGKFVQDTEQSGEEEQRERKTDQDGKKSKPFQTLHFLVRDWEFETYEPGAKGGMEYLEAVLNTKPDAGSELVEVRTQLRSCFEDLRCFLLPHPGLKIQKSTFKGDLKDITPEFKKSIAEFIPLVLKDENLVVKTVYGERVTCQGLFRYMHDYVSIFASGEIPKVTTVFEATARVNHGNVKQAAMDIYTAKMRAKCGPAQPFLARDRLTELHNATREEALKVFLETKKLHNDQIEQEFLSQLKTDIDTLYKELVEANDRKNVVDSFITPIVFFVVMFVVNIFGSIFYNIGLISIASLLANLSWICFLVLLVWGFSRFTGNFGEYLVFIDDISRQIYDLGKEGLMMGAAHLAANRN